MLLPPALVLDPKHLWGDGVTQHGWDLIYDRNFDDPRFRSWQDLMQQRGDLTQAVFNARDPNVVNE